MYDDGLQPLLYKSSELYKHLMGPETVDAVPKMSLSRDNYEDDVMHGALRGGRDKRLLNKILSH